MQAWKVGLPLNRLITINWALAGLSDAEARHATGRFLKLAGDWVRTRGQRIAWVWVRENGAGEGTHVHILLHLPPGLSLARLQLGWIKRISGRAYRRDTIDTRRIAGSRLAPSAMAEHYHRNLSNVLNYLRKGVDPELAARLGIRRVRATGYIEGKRVAWSQNIGDAARGGKAKASPTPSRSTRQIVPSGCGVSSRGAGRD
jgi:hypothetical protein